jgi:hypothetical protein
MHRLRWSLPSTLLVLTVATGLVDAVSVLGLGHVFTANPLDVVHPCVAGLSRPWAGPRMRSTLEGVRSPLDYALA